MRFTKRDQETLDFIKNYMKANGTTPTIREVGEGLGLYSTSSVHSHFKRLMMHGDLLPIKDKSFRYKVKGMRYVEDDSRV